MTTNCKGTWHIDYKVPTTPEIRYRTSPTANWVTIANGTSYTLEPVYGTNRSRSYILKIRHRWQYGVQSGQTVAENRWRREVVFYSVPIQGEIVGVLDDMSIGGVFWQSVNSYRWMGLGRAIVQTRNEQGNLVTRSARGQEAITLSSYLLSSNTHNDDIDPVGTPKASDSFGTVSGSWASVQARSAGGANMATQTIAGSTAIEAILPATANQPPDGYRLIVRDCNNTVISNLTFPTQPEVEKINSVVSANYSRHSLTAGQRLNYGYPIDGYYLVTDKRVNKKITVLLRHQNNPSFSAVIRELETGICATGNIELKISCSDKDECPEGTCEVTCTGHRCCVNAGGISVKTLPIGR